MRRLAALGAALFGLGATLALPGHAAAHALLLESDPAAASVLGGSPRSITLTFGEQPDPRLSSIAVLDTAGRDHTSGPVTRVAAEPLSLTVPVESLSTGVYTVTWRTVSTADGHASAGTFAFGVGVAPPSDGSVANDGRLDGRTGIAAAAMARWALYAGLIVLFGAAFVALAVHPAPPRSLSTLAASGWLVAAFGTAGVVAVQWADARADPEAVLGSSLGLAMLERVFVVLLTGVAVAVGLRGDPGRRRALGLVLLGAAGAMLVDTMTGHAAAGAVPVAAIGIQWLHVMAVGTWMGGLLALVVSVRGSPSVVKARAVRRFSSWAGLSLGVVAVTGLIRAIAEVETPDALLDTEFGRLIILKSLLLVVLAFLGMANRYVSVPVAARTLTRLRRISRIELAVGATALLLTGVLVNVVPPAAAQGDTEATLPPLVATGSDFGTSVHVRLTVAPGRPGFNEFGAVVTDYDTRSPAPIDRVSLRFSLASRPQMGSSTLELSPAGPGSFTASGTNLSLDGIWRIVAVLVGRDTAVEVPLALATRVRAGPVDEIAAPGVPTIHTAHLPGGESVQVYLDPGRPGQNQLHMTFFDATGAARPVRAVTVLVASEVGPSLLPNVKELDLGHFVGEVVLGTGAIGIDIIALVPGGGQLHVHIETEVG